MPNWSSDPTGSQRKTTILKAGWIKTRLILLLFFVTTQILFGQSEGIKKTIEKYQKNFFVWNEPENVNSNTDTVLTVLGRWAWGPCNAVDAEGNYAYIGNGPTFQVIDISEPSTPHLT